MLQKGVWKKTSFYRKTNIVSSIFADNTFRPQLLSVFSPVFISEPISRLSEFICSRIGYYLLSFRNISLLFSHQTLTLNHWLLKFLDLIELSEQKGSWKQCIISRLLTPSLKPLRRPHRCLRLSCRPWRSHSVSSVAWVIPPVTVLILLIPS